MVLIGEDPLARGGLHAQLAGAVEVELRGATSIDHLALALHDHRPDAFVWDLGVDPRGALARAAALSQTGVPFVALLADEGLAPEVVAAGAAGVLDREAPPEQIAAAAVAVAAGLLVAPPGMAGGTGLPRSGGTPPSEALTEREVEVMQLLSEGLSNKQIAARLEISEHTAKFHVNAILGKLGVQSRTEAVVRAARLGLVML